MRHLPGIVPDVETASLPPTQIRLKFFFQAQPQAVAGDRKRHLRWIAPLLAHETPGAGRLLPGDARLVENDGLDTLPRDNRQRRNP